MLLVALALPAEAALTAAVDRASVPLGQSLTLTVTLTGDAAGEPDLSGLERSFRVVKHTRALDYSTIDGNLTRRQTWKVVLVAQRRGPVTIPALTIGRQSTAPIAVAVTGPQPGDDDRLAFIEMDVSAATAYLQQQLFVTTRLYATHELLSTAITDPVADGAVVYQLGGPDAARATHGGVRYDLYVRHYVLFPLRAGELRLSPPVFEGLVNLRPGPLTPFGRPLPTAAMRTFYATLEERIIQVLPPPAGVDARTWLPASQITLRETLEPDQDSYLPGQPLTRVVELSADDQLHAQLPPLQVAEPEGVKTYVDEEGETFEDGRGVAAKRTTRWSYIPAQGGDLVLPEIRVPWWDVSHARARIAVIPSRTVTIAGAGAAAPAPRARAAPAPDAAAPAPRAAPTVAPALLAAFAVLGWLVTVLAWRVSRRRMQVAAASAGGETRRSVRARLQAALRDGDPAAVRAALMRWARVRWPEVRLNGLGELAARSGPALRTELGCLDRALYGRGCAWDARALAAALDKETAAARPKPRAAGALPPLYPEIPRSPSMDGLLGMTRG